MRYGEAEDISMKSLLVVIVCITCLVGWTRADCPVGDLTGDCRVDALDLQIVAEQWLAESHGSADIDGKGHVNLADFGLLASHWNETGCPIVINELLAHAHDVAPDWIELYNTSRVAVDIGGWFLSDDKKDLYKYQIADGTWVEPNEYVLFYENQSFGNPADPGALVPFAMSENGETLYLYSGDDARFPQCLVKEGFGASERSVSIGRYRKSTGDYDFTFMGEPTPGQVNAYPLVGPVVINEIMYHPDLAADAEYIELLNVSDAPVTFYDESTAEPWRMMHPAFWFPTNPPVTLQPDECLVLVKDMAAFGSRYAVPQGVQVLAWNSGDLGPGGKRLKFKKVRLAKPGDVDNQGKRQWIQVDEVDYSDGSHDGDFPHGLDPWPTGPDGFGLSLSRRLADQYGNDPNNWEAATASPGRPND